MIREIQDCFKSERILFTKHAKDEMEDEEFWEIREREVFEPWEGGRRSKLIRRTNLTLVA